MLIGLYGFFSGTHTTAPFAPVSPYLLLFYLPVLPPSPRYPSPGRVCTRLHHSRTIPPHQLFRHPRDNRNFKLKGPIFVHLDAVCCVVGFHPPCACRYQALVRFSPSLLSLSLTRSLSLNSPFFSLFAVERR